MEQTCQLNIKTSQRKENIMSERFLSQNLNQLKGFWENRVTVVADKLDIFPQKETDWCRQPAGAPRTQITTIYQTRRHNLEKRLNQMNFRKKSKGPLTPHPPSPHFRKIVLQILYQDNHYLSNESPLSEKKVTTNRPHNQVLLSNQIDWTLNYIFEGLQSIACTYEKIRPQPWLVQKPFFWVC